MIFYISATLLLFSLVEATTVNLNNPYICGFLLCGCITRILDVRINIGKLTFLI